MKPVSAAAAEFKARLARRGPPAHELHGERARTRHARVEESWFTTVPDDKAFRVLSALALHANEKGKCWPSRDTIAKLAGCSVQTVSAKTKLLKELGIITTHQRRRQSAIYFVNRTDPSNPAGATSSTLEKSKRGAQEINAESAKESYAAEREQTREHINIEQQKEIQETPTETKEERDLRLAQVHQGWQLLIERAG